MLPSVKMKVLSFCAELSSHDPWEWKDTSQKLLKDINYDAPSVLRLNKDFYQIACVLSDGRLLELSRFYKGGWSIKYESPEDAKARQESGLTPRAADDGDSLVVDDLPFFGWEPNEGDYPAYSHRG